MINKKLHFVIDKTIKSKKLSKIFSKKYKNYSPKISDVIVVIGGDGFMLESLKKYQKYKKPFFGMNKGTFGFLMNKFRIHNIKSSINKARPIDISALEMSATATGGLKKKVIAINEISLLRQSRQTASLQIISNRKTLIKKLMCDGVLVSTPAGSTAYNMSANGPILSLNSKKLAITPISPFRPRRWRGKIVASTSLIEVKNLNNRKRPISVVADNFEVRNIKNVKIRINNNINFKLLYDKNNNLNKKIKLEQFKKNSIF